MSTRALTQPEKAHIVTALAVIAAAVTTFAVLRSSDSGSSSIGAAAPLLLLAAVAFGALMIRFSAAGVAILVAFVYLDISEALVRFHQFPSLLQFLVVGLAFAAWLKSDTEELSTVAFQGITVTLAAWLFFSLMTTTWAANRHLADERFGDRAKAFALFALATLLMRNRHRLKQGLIALAGSAAFLSALVIVNVATGNLTREFGGLARYKNAQIYSDVFEPRVAGPVGDPNFFAQVLLLVFPLAVVMVPASKKAWQKAAWLAASAMILFTILATYSRGAFIALFVMTLLLLHTLHVHWQKTVAAVALILVILIALPPDITRRFFTIEQIVGSRDEVTRPDSSVEERKLLMMTAAEMFLANPFVGVGIGNYTEHYDEYSELVGSNARLYEEPSARHFPHNLYLETAAETGVVGLTLFGALIVAAWFALLDAERRFAAASDAEMELVTAAFRIALFGFLLTSLFLHLAVPRYLLLLLAFAATLQRLSGRETAKTA